MVCSDVISHIRLLVFFTDDWRAAEPLADVENHCIKSFKVVNIANMGTSRVTLQESMAKQSKF